MGPPACRQIAGVLAAAGLDIGSSCRKTLPHCRSGAQAFFRLPCAFGWPSLAPAQTAGRASSMVSGSPPSYPYAISPYTPAAVLGCQAMRAENWAGSRVVKPYCAVTRCKRSTPAGRCSLQGWLRELLLITLMLLTAGSQGRQEARGARACRRQEGGLVQSHHCLVLHAHAGH